jgi:hypothetical protein
MDSYCTICGRIKSDRAPFFIGLGVGLLCSPFLIGLLAAFVWG